MKTLNWVLALILLFAAKTFAADYTLDFPSSGVTGEMRSIRAKQEETLLDIARRFDLGYDEIIKANPKVNRWIPGEGTEVLLPMLYILPDGPRDGIVVNTSERRLYYYDKSSPGLVRTFPVSLGRMDWRTPLGKTKVVRKQADPPWYPPASIRAEHAAEDEELPKFIPGGSPDNPLGLFALYLGVPGYLIHGVDQSKAFGIGMLVTHGCIRMYPEDIEPLYKLVPVGTPVYLVEQHVKIGRNSKGIYLEINLLLPEERDFEPSVNISVDEVLAALEKINKGDYEINEDLVERAIQVGDGVPVLVSDPLTLPPPRRALE